MDHSNYPSYGFNPELLEMAPPHNSVQEMLPPYPMYSAPTNAPLNAVSSAVYTTVNPIYPVSIAPFQIPDQCITEYGNVTGSLVHYNTEHAQSPVYLEGFLDRRPTYQTGMEHFTESSPSNDHQPPNVTQSVTEMQQVTATVVPVNPFDPRHDAEMLHKAMKGLGSDELALINILCRRSSIQRHQISLSYKSMYGKDLKNKLKSELSFNFQRVMVALCQPLFEFLATELYDSMKGLGTKEDTLIEIICSANNFEMQAISSAYRQLFSRSLEDDIRGDTSGDFKRILVALIQGMRDENHVVDMEKAKMDAQRLYSAGEGRLGTEESTFISILASRSLEHLRQIMVEYQLLYGKSLEEAIRSEFSGYIEKALLAILQCIENRHTFFAQCLHRSMVGLGTRDRNLIRLVVVHCDIDLGTIKEEYKRIHNKDLAASIASETSGSYKKALLTLVG